MSFVAGHKDFGTLIALLHNNKPILGIIDCPAHKERWVGLQNISERRADASLFISFPSHFSTSTDGFSKVVHIIVNKLAGRLGMITKPPRGDFYPILCSGCRETDGPVIAAEPRIREFGSSASSKSDAKNGIT